MKVKILLVLFLVVSVHLMATHGPQFQVINNCANSGLPSVDVWVANNFFSYKVESNLDYKKATRFNGYTKIYGPPRFIITEVGSLDTTNALVKKTFDLPYDSFHTLVLAGEPGISLDLYLEEDALKESAQFNRVSVKFFHGSTNAPQLSISEVSVPAGTLATGLNFSDSKGYLNFKAMNYIFQFNAVNGTLAEFTVPFNTFADSSLFIVASGYLSSIGTSAPNSFKLLVVLASGNVIEIDPNQSLISVDEEFSLTKLDIYPNPSSNFINLDISLTKDESSIITIYNMNGVSVRKLSKELMKGQNTTQTIDVSKLNEGLYILTVESGNNFISRKFKVLK